MKTVTRIVYQESLSWIRDTLDEGSTGVNAMGTAWDSNLWDNLGAMGVFPCLKNMPNGAAVCE